MSGEEISYEGFQSALPRGERLPTPVLIAISVFDFNPRSREGSDGKVKIKEDIFMLISIRAPARGATTRKEGKTMKNMISIRAPARGATQ